MEKKHNSHNIFAQNNFKYAPSMYTYMLLLL